MGQRCRSRRAPRATSPPPSSSTGTGREARRPRSALMGAEVSEITGEGGVVASFSTSTAMGTDTGDAVWYTGDFAMADQILACAVQQLNIDTRQIYTAGCSAGGLQAGAMVCSRSSYLAARDAELGRHHRQLLHVRGQAHPVAHHDARRHRPTWSSSRSPCRAQRRTWRSPPRLRAARRRAATSSTATMAAATAERPPTTSRRSGSSARTTRSGSRRTRTQRPAVELPVVLHDHQVSGPTQGLGGRPVQPPRGTAASRIRARILIAPSAGRADGQAAA